jgi:hypothetical protein
MSEDAWQQAEEMLKQHEQSAGLWLKLANDKDRAVVVFLGAPYWRDVCFVDGKYVLFDEQLKAQGERAVTRVAFNVALYDTKEVKVLEQGVVFFKDLMQIRRKYGLTSWAFEVERHGAAKDPKTTYSILPEHQLSPEQVAEFQALVLHDLPAVYAGGGGHELDSYDRTAGREGHAQPKAAAPVEAGAVVDERTAQLLVTELKKLPRAAAERFCATFRIDRIKELPATQIKKALATLEALVAEFNPTEARSAPTPDPFA